VKTAAMLNQSVGYDAGKKIKGRKRFVTVDTLGLVLSVLAKIAQRAKNVHLHFKPLLHQAFSNLT
jgi:hypothetical protein